MSRRAYKASYAPQFRTITESLTATKQIGASAAQIAQLGSSDIKKVRLPLERDNETLVSKDAKEVGSSIYDQPVYMPFNQLYDRSFARQQRTIPCNPAAATTAFSNSGVQVPFNLPRGGFTRVHNPCLRYTLSSSSDVVLCPAAEFAERIECWSPNNLLQFTYGDMNWILSQCMNDDEKRYPISKLANVDPRWGGRDENCVLRAGTSRSYTVPLIGNCWSALNLWLGLCQQDPQMRIYIRSPITVSGTNANITLTNLEFLFEEDAPNTKLDELETPLKLQTAVEARNFMDHVQQILVGQTLTAGVKNSFNLAQFRGKCAALFVMIRSGSGNPVATSDGLTNCVCIGTDSSATVEITSRSSEGIIGRGVPNAAAVFTNIAATQSGFANASFFAKRNIYPIVMCHDFAAAMAGSSDGWFDIPDYTTFSLDITCAPAGTACVYTITTDAAPTAGTYNVAVNIDGETCITSTSLAYNANASTIQTAINALPCFVRRGLSVTVSAALSAGTATTITFPVSAGNVECAFSILYNSVTTTTTTAVALSTPGVSGFVTASTYSVYIYALMQREIKTHPSPNGLTMTVRDR